MRHPSGLPWLGFWIFMAAWMLGNDYQEAEKIKAEAACEARP